MTRELARVTTCIAEARSLACDWADGLSADRVWVLELIVSELVTNAVRHGAGRLTLTLTEVGGHVHIEVHDHSAQLPVSRYVKGSDTATGGRGLGIISELSQAWGVTSDGSGKTVWADLALTPLHEA